MNRITEIYKTKQAPLISFEIFPPKTSSELDALYKMLQKLNLKAGDVDYISVTYGAGGTGNQENTRLIAEYIQNKYQITTLHNLTSIKQTPHSLKACLESIRVAGIENIFALRGDLQESDCISKYYPFAKDLIREIKQYGYFDVGAAIHPEIATKKDVPGNNLDVVKEKVARGTNFFISQLFFDNSVFYDMQNVLKENDIETPVSAGIVPIVSREQMAHLTSISGASVPERLANLVHKYGDDAAGLREAGMEYALDQIYDLLAHGVDGIHLYAMNQLTILQTMIPKINKHIELKKFNV